jgi:chlorobactene glucosyltransferase
MVNQDYPNFELIAINDRSDDDTGLILDRLAEEFPDRLKVVHVRHLRDGWKGKPNAMWEGMSIAQGDWLCFIDADCRQTSERTLSLAMREASEHETDFLSVLPVLETKSFWERLIQPVCAAVLIIWFHPRNVNNPAKKTAYANGAFMLMAREVYDQIGGHERVRSELNEDMVMSRVAKGAGVSLRVIQNEGLYLTRMYDSFSAAVRGWSRIFAGSMLTKRMTVAAFAVMFFSSFVPWVCLISSSIGLGVSGWSAWGPLFCASLLAVLMLHTCMWRFYALLKAYPRYSLLYPLGVVLTLGMLVSALTRQLGIVSTTWRGRTYEQSRGLDRPGGDDAESATGATSEADAAKTTAG